MTTSIRRQTHCPRLNSMRFPVARIKISPRSGLTLVEILIALTMTLVVLGAMAQAFSFASKEIANGRAILEMSNKLRNAQQLLRTDLAGVTVEIRPHTENIPQGYFEYIDGPASDRSAAGTTDAYLGDVDDIVAFTARNLEGNFRGRVNMVDPGSPDDPTTDFREIIQASFAEIVWFAEPVDVNNDGVLLNAAGNINYADTLTLYRRVLLIRPNLNGAVSPSGGTYLPFFTGEEASDPQAEKRVARFFINNDISARWIDSNGDGSRDQIVANSLEDLARRENRFSRDSLTFPHVFDVTAAATFKAGLAQIVDNSGNRSDASGDLAAGYTGDDILLTDVAAFDVKAYSPTSFVNQVDLDGNGPETFLTSSDVGFVNPAVMALPPGTTATQNGDFVDLGSVIDTTNFDADGDGNFDLRTAISTVGSLNNVLSFVDYQYDPGAVNFWTLPTSRSRLAYLNPLGGMDVAYCTWSPHYETDGINQDAAAETAAGGRLIVDQGTDGFDLDPDGTGPLLPVNGVDDDSEKETAPPYPYPIRGLEVKFRMIEKNSRQVRQSTVVQNFLTQ